MNSMACTTVRVLGRHIILTRQPLGQKLDAADQTEKGQGRNASVVAFSCLMEPSEVMLRMEIYATDNIMGKEIAT